jgi:pimeloyl-ACP methyl ester carboxylesterase
MMWHESGGSGDCTVLLLHGVGATAAVWNAVRQALDARGAIRWLVADLSGHGESDWQPLYSVGQLAADTASLLRNSTEVFVVGHSLGAYVGLALASRWFGIAVRGVLAVGPKVTWSASDLETARELAARPIRWYATEPDALARYRRISGLNPDIAPAVASLARGIVREEEGWRLAQDPRSFAAAGAPFAPLVTGAAARVVLARGEHDSLVSSGELAAHAVPVHTIAGAGHNVHVEQPDAILALLERLIEDAALDARRQV